MSETQKTNKQLADFEKSEEVRRMDKPTPEYKEWLERTLTLTDLTKDERAELEETLKRVITELA